MLPTPSTDHVPFSRIYEPAEDSYLLLDTLSSPAETLFLSSRFTIPLLSRQPQPPTPLILEIGTGSGIVLAFLTAHASIIFSRSDVLALGVDVNIHACHASAKTVQVACKTSVEEYKSGGRPHGYYVGNIASDLNSSIRDGTVDVLIFNPPYVPTEELPVLPEDQKFTSSVAKATISGNRTDGPTYDEDSQFLALSYAGGEDGMEITNRLLENISRMLSERGVAYILLCAQNKPKAVVEKLKAWGENWEVELVGSSGKTAGWEKLCIVRIARVL